MALVECLQYIPADHPQRNEVITLLQKICASILKYQDKESGLWYQVIDQPTKTGNWIETSCSAMFAYTFAKGYNMGWLDKAYHTSAQKAYTSLLDNYVFFDEEGKLYFDQTVKIGTLNPKNSKGDFDYYINTERRINDYKGLASLLYASLELNQSAQ